MQVLIVDAANVVGSRPDGWWRDRPGAATRLHDKLAGWQQSRFETIVLILEGAAKAGQPAGHADGVITVHAPASGDDEIVRRAADDVRRGDEVTAVTADRALRARIEAVGGACTGPSYLLGEIG